MVVISPRQYADKGHDYTVTWELKLVENLGEIVGSPDSKEVAVPTQPLIKDMKDKLDFLPKNFTWTVGWRTYVWQEKETQKFKDLTTAEYKELYIGGTLNHPEDDGGSNTQSESSSTDNGSTAE